MSERFEELLQDLTREFQRQAAEIRTLRESLRKQPQAPIAKDPNGVDSHCSDDSVVEVQPAEYCRDVSQPAESAADEAPSPRLSTPSPRLSTPSPCISSFQRQVPEKTDVNGRSSVRASALFTSRPPQRQSQVLKRAESRISISEDAEKKVAAISSHPPVSRSATTLTTVGTMYTIRKPWYLINPEQSMFMSRWDIITIAALAYVALVTPVQVGLMESNFDFWFVVSLCVDCVFFFDMGLQFFLMYPVKKTGGFEMEHRPRRIIIHYLTTWFPIDFLTLVPFDVLSMALATDALSKMKGIKIIRLLRLLKLIRILKASRVFHRMEIGMSIPYQRFALGKFLAILVLVCHWQTCIWSMTLTMNDETTSRWIDSFDLMEANVDDKTKNSAVKIYVAAFYFCSYTMTSVGYGDIGPKNILERGVCIMIILVSGLCWAYILGEVCGIVSDMNAEAQSFRKKMDNLNFMMQERSLSTSLRMRLRSYFISNKSSVKHLTQKQLLHGMSPSLQGEVSMALNGDWLRKVSFLNGFLQEAAEAMSNLHCADYEGYRACVSDVARTLDTSSYAQGEIFGEVHVLYILYKGLVGMNSRVLKQGSVWGEDFVLSDSSVVKKPMSTALTYVEVIFLTRESFMEVVLQHRMSCPALSLRTRQFCVRVAVRRGILSYAMKKRTEEKLNCLRNSATISLPIKSNHADHLIQPDHVTLPNCVSIP